MTLIIGFIVVLAATNAGYMFAGGKLYALTMGAWQEYVIVLGISLGLLIIASPMSLLKNILNKIKISFRNQAVPTEDYTDALKLLFELFTKARRGGLIAIEDDVVTPDQSLIFQKYPSFLNDHERREFLCNGLKPIIDGRLKPEQLAQMLEGDLESKHEDAHLPVQTLNLVGDSLPGIGIVAAVMGIINTMGSISEGAEKVGMKVGAALVGTFLGVFVAYGFVNPLAARIKLNNVYEMQYYTLLMKGIVGFTGGMAPLMAVEYARRAIDPAFQPTSEEVENMVKSIGTGA
jgi:chemotaxis protein MotA